MIQNIKTFLKKINYFNKKNFVVYDYLNFSSPAEIINQEKKYWNQQLTLEKEKFEKELENKYNDYYNYSSFVNKNISMLQKKLVKNINYENNQITKLEEQLNNHKISNELYAVSKAKLTIDINKNINQLELKTKKRISLIEKTHKKRGEKIRKKINQYKTEYQDFITSLEKGANTRVEKLKNELKQKNCNNFYAQRQQQLNNQFQEAKKNFKTNLNNLNQSYLNKKITLNAYQKTEKKLYKIHVSKIKKLNTQAEKNPNNIALLQAKTHFSRNFSQEKFIVYGNTLFKKINDSKLIIFFIFISMITGVFFKDQYYSTQNWFGAILGSNIAIGFIALGETLVILTAGIDLSVGSMIGFGGTIYMTLAHVSQIGIAPSLIVMFIATILIGWVSGYLISRFKIPPFIITLAGLLTLRGAVNIILQGVPISSTNDPLLNFLSFNINNQFPISILLFMFVCVILIFFIKFSKFGRYVYAVGDNIQAAKYSGINVKKILTVVYLLSAFLAGFGAIVAVSNVNSVSPQTGTSLELDAITAVALGGTSFMGGKGGLGKTLIGWFSIALLMNALNFWGISSNVQFVVKGVIIVIALMIDRNFDLLQKIKISYYRFLSYV